MSCQAKKIKVSSDGINFFTITGQGGSLSFDGEDIDDTILGQCFKSSQTGLINSTISSSAFYKGFAGYEANIKKGGTPVATTGEATTTLDTLVYQITDPTKQLISNNFTVYDDGNDITSSVEKVDWFSGTFYVKAGTTISGAVTADIESVPLTTIGRANGLDLTMTSDVQDDTTFDIAQANSGFRSYIAGLKEVGLAVTGLYDQANDYLTTLVARGQLIMDIEAHAGREESYARGIFQLNDNNLSGDVGAIETEDPAFLLYVPVEEKLLAPFKWYHPAGSTIPEAVKIIMTAWENNSKIYVKYQPTGDGIGSSSYDGEVVVSDTSMSSDLGSMVEFSLELQVSGALTINTIA